MAKKSMKAVPTEPRDPRPPEPTPPLGGPADNEPAREVLVRVRRFLSGKETLARVYGGNWYYPAQADLHRVRTSREFVLHRPQESYHLAGVSAGLEAAWVQGQIDAAKTPTPARPRPRPRPAPDARGTGPRPAGSCSRSESWGR